MGLNQCFEPMVLVKVSGVGSFLSLLFALVLGLVCKPISPSKSIHQDCYRNQRGLRNFFSISHFLMATSKETVIPTLLSCLYVVSLTNSPQECIILQSPFQGGNHFCNLEGLLTLFAFIPLYTIQYFPRENHEVIEIVKGNPILSTKYLCPNKTQPFLIDGAQYFWQVLD